MILLKRKESIKLQSDGLQGKKADENLKDSRTCLGSIFRALAIGRAIVEDCKVVKRLSGSLCPFETSLFPGCPKYISDSHPGLPLLPLIISHFLWIDYHTLLLAHLWIWPCSPNLDSSDSSQPSRSLLVTSLQPPNSPSGQWADCVALEAGGSPYFQDIAPEHNHSDSLFLTFSELSDFQENIFIMQMHCWNSYDFPNTLAPSCIYTASIFIQSFSLQSLAHLHMSSVPFCLLPALLPNYYIS